MDKKTEVIVEALERCAELLRAVPEDATNVQTATRLDRDQMDLIEGIVTGDIPRAFVLYPVGMTGIGYMPINSNVAEMRGLAEGFLDLLTIQPTND